MALDPFGLQGSLILHGDDKRAARARYSLPDLAGEAAICITGAVGFKRLGDRGLYYVVGRILGRLPTEDAAIMILILDHIHAVDQIFQHRLQGLPHSFKAARSEEMPDFQALATSTRNMGGWYAAYVDEMATKDFEQTVDFIFTSGTLARMRRGEIFLHVCLHGTYHRGNAGLALQKNGITPSRDGITDFLNSAI